MTDSEPTAYELDMADEAKSLRRFADARMPEALGNLDLAGFDRIVLTGMGGSDFAALPFELRLAQAGLPVWRMPTGRLLEMRALVTAGTLLVITSQSGRSGEVVALLEQLDRRPKAILGITNDSDSPLAAAADHIVLMRSGPEATVATKTFANTVAAFHRLAGMLLDHDESHAVSEIHGAAVSLQMQIEKGNPAIDALVQRVSKIADPRFAFIGSAGSDAAVALAGALVMKEAAKVPAEGYVGGAFRHGPLELAGPRLVAVLFGRGGADEPSPHALARDLAATGSTVATIAPAAYDGSGLIPILGTTDFERLLHGMHAVQLLSVGLARAAGLVPGAFLYGQKITAQL